MTKVNFLMLLVVLNSVVNGFAVVEEMDLLHSMFYVTGFVNNVLSICLHLRSIRESK